MKITFEIRKQNLSRREFEFETKFEVFGYFLFLIQTKLLQYYILHSTKRF